MNEDVIARNRSFRVPCVAQSTGPTARLIEGTSSTGFFHSFALWLESNLFNFIQF
jgi:hypothetical protein